MDEMPGEVAFRVGLANAVVIKTVRKNMKSVSTLLMALTILTSSFVMASPIDDLASPDQMVRDKAAAVLRTTYQSAPESKWTPTIDKIKKGLPEKEIRELLLQLKVTEEASCGDGETHSHVFRLDNDWILDCQFKSAVDPGDEILIDRKLSQYPKGVEVYAPEDYTGRWVIYFINGNKGVESNYKNGQYIGENIVYYPNGSMRFIQHYTEKGLDGYWTGYHPSGSVEYCTPFKEGKEVGTETWYDETGKVIETREFPNP